MPSEPRFFAAMMAQWPARGEGDRDVLAEIFREDLAGYASDIVEEAWREMRRERPRSAGRPTTGDFCTVCDAVVARRERAAQPRGAPVIIRTVPIEDQIEAAMRSPTAQKLIALGAARQVERHVKKHGRPPSDRDVDALVAGARREEASIQAAIDAVGDPDAAPGLARCAGLGRAILEREDKLARRFLIEQATA